MCGIAGGEHEGERCHQRQQPGSGRGRSDRAGWWVKSRPTQQKTGNPRKILPIP